MDNRPYPRIETCSVCGERPCNPINPADDAICDSCHLALMGEPYESPWAGMALDADECELAIADDPSLEPIFRPRIERLRARERSVT